QPTETPAGPLIVGVGDLQDPRLVRLVRKAYLAGEAVGLTNATRAAAAGWPGLVGHPGAAGWTSKHPPMDLINLRRATRADASAPLLPELVAPSEPLPGRLAPSAVQDRAQRHGEAYRLELLSRTFSESPVVPDRPEDDGPLNLLQLADSYESKGIGTDNA